MTESDFTVGRSVGFLLAVAIAVSLQRITPWWASELWAVNFS